MEVRRSKCGIVFDLFQSVECHSALVGPATNKLLQTAHLRSCKNIFEYGCGCAAKLLLQCIPSKLNLSDNSCVYRAGQLAERILEHEQSSDLSINYLGIDLSPNMAKEASSRLDRFGEKAVHDCLHLRGSHRRARHLSLLLSTSPAILHASRNAASMPLRHLPLQHA